MATCKLSEYLKKANDLKKLRVKHFEIFSPKVNKITPLNVILNSEIRIDCNRFSLQ